MSDSSTSLPAVSFEQAMMRHDIDSYRNKTWSSRSDLVCNAVLLTFHTSYIPEIEPQFHLHQSLWLDTNIKRAKDGDRANPRVDASNRLRTASSSSSSILSEYLAKDDPGTTGNREEHLITSRRHSYKRSVGTMSHDSHSHSHSHSLFKATSSVDILLEAFWKAACDRGQQISRLTTPESPRPLSEVKLLPRHQIR